MSDEDEKKGNGIRLLKPDFQSIIDRGTEGLSEEGWMERDKAIGGKLVAEDRERNVAAWAETKQRLIDLGLGAKALRKLYAGNNILHTSAMDAISGFSEGVLVLSGNPGCGKSFSATAWLLNSYKSAGEWSVPADWRIKGIRFAEASWFARMSRYGQDEDKFELLARPSFLVLDDLGVEYNDEKGSFATDIDELINTRWKHERPTIITTNLVEAAFRGRYGERIIDRCNDGGAWASVQRESLR